MRKIVLLFIFAIMLIPVFHVKNIAKPGEWSKVSAVLNAGGELKSNTIYAGAGYINTTITWHATTQNYSISYYMFLFTQAGDSYPPTGGWRYRWRFIARVYITPDGGYIEYADLHEISMSSETTSICHVYSKLNGMKIQNGSGVIIAFGGSERGANPAINIYVYDKAGFMIANDSLALDSCESDVSDYYTYFRNWHSEFNDRDCSVNVYQHGSGSGFISVRAEIHKYKMATATWIPYFPRIGMPLQYYIPPQEWEPDINWEYSSYDIYPANTFTQYIGYDTLVNITLADRTVLFNLSYSRWEYNFTTVAIESITQHFYYTFTRAEEWGDWGLFNWLRDGLVAIYNGLQWIYVLFAYALTVLANSFWYLLLLIYTIIYNYVWYYIYTGVLYVAWGVGYLLFWLLYLIIQGVVLLSNLIMPLIQFITNLVVNIIAFVYACVVWGFAGGDFWEIYNNMVYALGTLFNTILATIQWLLYNAPLLIQIAILYASIWLFAYLKMQYVKSKGYTVRKQQLQNVCDALLNPVNAVYNFMLKVKKLIAGWL